MDPQGEGRGPRRPRHPRPHPLALGIALPVVLLSPLLVASATGIAPRSVMDELASAAGMLAFAIILAEFALSGRTRSVSGRVGMDVTMRVHQLIARTAVVLALLHPFLYRALWADPRPWDTERLLTVTAEPARLWSGIAAFVILPVFVGMSIARGWPDYRYEGWRILHGLGAALLGGLLLHHALEAGRYAAHPAMIALWVLLAGLAGLAFLRAYLSAPLLQLRRPWRVVSVAPAARRIWAVEVAPDGHPGIAYEAGQFAWLNIGRNPFARAENPFSIASAPAEGPNLRFLIKELGDFTNALGSVQPGTRAYVDAPHGALTVPDDAPGVALIGGGVGLAPLIGILRQMALSGDPRPRALVYGDGAAEDIACRAELERLGQAPGTEVIFALERPPEGWTGHRGRIDPAFLRALFDRDDRRGWVFILCGPPPMLGAVEDALMSMGIPPARILQERFDYD